MTSARRLLSVSIWTRLLLGALGLTFFGLMISAFLAALLGAAGDSVGNLAFSAFNLGLASFAVAECVALIAVVAIRTEFSTACQD